MWIFAGLAGAIKSLCIHSFVIFELSLVGFLIKYLWNDFERFPLLIHSYHLLTLKKIFFLSKPFTAFEVSRFLKTDVNVHMQEETKANKHSQKSVSVDWGLLSGSDAASLRHVTLWLYTQAEGSGKLPSWKEATQRIKGPGFMCCRNSRKSGSDSECHILNFLLIHDTDVSPDI